MKLVLLLAAGAFAAQDVTPPVISLTFADWVGHQDGRNADGAYHAWDDTENEGSQHTLPAWYTTEMGNRANDEKVSKRASVTCVVDKDNTDATTTACPDPSCTATDHHDDSVVCDEPRVMQISKSARDNGDHVQAYTDSTYTAKDQHWRKAHGQDDGTWGDDRISSARSKTAQVAADDCTPNAQTTCVKRSQLGQYLVTYTATDASGNKAEPIAFTFIFIDPIVPQFSFGGADASQAHGSTGYDDKMNTWPQHFTVGTTTGGAVWNEDDVTVVSTTNTFGHIVSLHATSKTDGTSVVPTPQITEWGTTATTGSDIVSYTAFATGTTATSTNALANVEAGNCNQLFGGAQTWVTADVDAKCGRTSANGNWNDYNLDVTVTDNYRASASIKVFSRISVSTSTPSTSWTEHSTSSTTTTLCMEAGKKFTIDWYADDEAGIFGWKHKSNPQAHRVQISVTDNTRPTIHPLGADGTALLREDERDASATAYSTGSYAGTWSAAYACKGFHTDCATKTSLATCVAARDSGCVWTKTLAMQTSDCDDKTTQGTCETPTSSCKWHTYSTLTSANTANGLVYSTALTKCRSTNENQAHTDANHETSDLLQCGHDGTNLKEAYVERGFDVYDNQDGMTSGCTGWKRVKCEFPTAAAATAQDDVSTKTAATFATTTGTCSVDNTDLHNSDATANLGGAQQLPTGSQAAFAADYTVTYGYKDSNGNVAAPVTRRVVVVDTVPPTLSLQGDCVIQNSAGAHYNSSALEEDIAESSTNGLFDHDRIARFFSHRDDCDRKVHTVVTLHSGGCTWATTGGAASGEGNCHGTASGAKLGCQGGDATNSNCFLGVFEWNGDEDAQSAESASTFADLMGTTKTQYHQEFHEYIAGEYAVQYKTQDASGHFVTACRKIQNVDHTYPIIQILGSDQMTLEATHQGNYIDDGATCSDQVDGVISQNVEVSGDVVNLSKVGTYTITYNCKDSANNAAPAAQRTVVVAQTSCPKCTVHGTDVVHEASFPYSDAGASCSDVIDGDVTTLCFTASYGTDGGVAAAGTKEDQFAGGATWTGKGYCDEMEGQTNAACAGMTRTDCTGTASCKWNQYSACDTSAAGSNNLITDAAVQGTTNSGAQIGTYYITYRAKNTVGLYNDGANCRGGAIEYIRKVEVKDTLRPVITLKYDSGSGDATVAQGDLSPTDAATADLSLSDTASDKQYPSVTGAYASQGNFDDSYGGNHEAQHTLMAEESTSSVNGWVIGAIASAVAGLALLGYSTRRTAVATSVPV